MQGFDLDRTKSPSKDLLMKYTFNGRVLDNRHSSLKEKTNTNKNVFNFKGLISTNSTNNKDLNISSNKIPVSRKIKTNLKNIEETSLSSKEQKYIYNDLPVTSAVKQIKTCKESSNLIIIDQDIELSKTNSKETFEDSYSEEDVEIVKNEGFLHKLTETKKLKKLWFKLHHKDLYYFRNEKENVHKGMHNLSGVFLKEETKTTIDGVEFFTFSVVYPKKVRYYFVDNEEEYKRWVISIKRATGYVELTDIYDVKEKLGNGKFGLVRLGINKQTGQKVAIKIMNKKDMNNQDLELVRTEIEILKICQHPYIIRLLDIFENIDYIYIIMEHCSGGDLFSYIEKRGFKLPEIRACQLIHKLCCAIFYVHAYGIAHRDLKPENILMTDCTDEADIRLLDFGLSKITGPTQFCNEPYGTLSYVAPEVLLEQPYTKAVDLWSIGITTYLLLAGSLPFDDEHSEREIARQTIHDPVHWGSIWKKLSTEAKSFVESKIFSNIFL